MRIILITLFLSSQLAIGKAYFLPLMPRDNTVEFLGDCISVVNPLLGIATIFYHEDIDGFGELFLTEATTIVSTELLKAVFDKANFFGYQPGRRPNGSRKNFPSGHTATAFAASQFVYKRYGPKMGIPLTVLSIFTGVSRIYAHKHDIIAVMGGAAIALFAAEIFVKSFKNSSSNLLLNFDGRNLLLAFQLSSF